MKSTWWGIDSKWYIRSVVVSFLIHFAFAGLGYLRSRARREWMIHSVWVVLFLEALVGALGKPLPDDLLSAKEDVLSRIFAYYSACLCVHDWQDRYWGDLEFVFNFSGTRIVIGETHPIALVDHMLLKLVLWSIQRHKEYLDVEEGVRWVHSATHNGIVGEVEFSFCVMLSQVDLVYFLIKLFQTR